MLFIIMLQESPRMLVSINILLEMLLVFEEKNFTINDSIGLTVIDFIVLPARARLSIAYSGEYEGEGFLGLKRL